MRADNINITVVFFQLERRYWPEDCQSGTASTQLMHMRETVGKLLLVNAAEKYLCVHIVCCTPMPKTLKSSDFRDL